MAPRTATQGVQNSPGTLVPCCVISCGFLQNFFPIVLCARLFVTCQARLQMKHVCLKRYPLDLAERWQVCWRIVENNALVTGGLNSSLEVTVDHEPSYITAPAEHLSLAIQLPIFHSLLRQHFSALPLQLMREGSPHKQTSSARNSPDKKLLVCNEKMSALKPLCSLPLLCIINTTTKAQGCTL